MPQPRLCSRTRQPQGVPCGAHRARGGGGLLQRRKVAEGWLLGAVRKWSGCWVFGKVVPRLVDHGKMVHPISGIQIVDHMKYSLLNSAVSGILRENLDLSNGVFSYCPIYPRIIFRHTNMMWLYVIIKRLGVGWCWWWISVFFCDLLVGKYKQLVPFPRVKGGDSPGRRNEIHLGMQWWARELDIV